MTAAQPLPELPDIEAARQAARIRLEHFTRIRDEAQAEINKANAWLNGIKPVHKTPARNKTITVAALKAVLTAIGNHDGASAETVAKECGYSTSYTHQIAKHAEREGLITRTRRQRNRFVLRLTDAGTELVTS